MCESDCFAPIRDVFSRDFEKPSYVEEVSLASLSPFQRALLVMDGTVTKFIEAYTMEEVDVAIIDQVNQVLASPNRELDATEGTLRESFHNSLRLRRTAVIPVIGVRLHPHTALYQTALEEGAMTTADDLL